MLKISLDSLKVTLTRVHDGSVVGSFISSPTGPKYTRFMQNILGVAKARFLWVYANNSDYKGEPTNQAIAMAFGAMDPLMSGNGTDEGRLTTTGHYIEKVLGTLHSEMALFVTPRYGDPLSLMKLTVEKAPTQESTIGDTESPDETTGGPATANTLPIRMEF